LETHLYQEYNFKIQVKYIMVKTFRKRSSNAYSRKNRSTGSTMSAFLKQITVVFLEMLMMIKLFHWKTHSYATHKATDQLYDSLNDNNFIN
jgi:hypothetical protein